MCSDSRSLYSRTIRSPTGHRHNLEVSPKQAVVIRQSEPFDDVSRPARITYGLGAYHQFACERSCGRIAGRTCATLQPAQDTSCDISATLKS